MRHRVRSHRARRRPHPGSSSQPRRGSCSLPLRLLRSSRQSPRKPAQSFQRAVTLSRELMLTHAYDKRGASFAAAPCSGGILLDCAALSAEESSLQIVALDLEGVLVPEIWIAFSERTGIPELRRTTRDEPDYDKLM